MMAKLRNPIVSVVLSLGLSLGVGVGASWGPLSQLVAEAAKPKKTGKAISPELKARGWDFWTIEIENLSNELKAERLRLKQQAEFIEQRSARLAAEEKEFVKIRAEVEAVRKQVTDHILEITADEAKNIRTLAATYANLTPRGAVAIMKEMDDTTVVKILALMKADVVGPIFEEMSRSATPDAPLAKRAAQLSEKLRLMKPPKAGGAQ